MAHGAFAFEWFIFSLVTCTGLLIGALPKKSKKNYYKIAGYVLMDLDSVSIAVRSHALSPSRLIDSRQIFVNRKRRERNDFS